jgi:hypothetical protein
MARVTRQNLALLVLLGLIVVACGQGQQQDPAYIGDGNNAVTAAQIKDPTYEPNPEFDEFVRKKRLNQIPREKPTGQKPAEMRVDEPEYVGDPTEPEEKEPIPDEKVPPVETTTANPPATPPPSTSANPGVLPATPITGSVPANRNTIPKTSPRTNPQPAVQPIAKTATSNTIPKTGNSVGKVAVPTNLYRRGEKCKNLIYLPTTQAWCQHHNGRLYNGFQLEPVTGVYLSDQFKGKQFTTREVEETIHNVGLEFYKTFNKNTLIGSASKSGGGPILNAKGRPAHASHENGLDLDVFLSRKHEDQPLTYTAHTRTGEPYTKLIVDNFDHRATMWHIKEYNRSNRVYHFFVSHEVKAFLCKEYPNDIIHTKLSKYEGHYTHFHVKFHCDQSAEASCVPFEKPITNGTECPRNGRI